MDTIIFTSTNTRLLVLSQSDSSGGAARAAYRLFTGFLSTGINTTMLVAHKSSNEENILQISKFHKLKSSIYSRLDYHICRFLLPNSKEWKTSGLFGVVSARQLNRSDFNVINIHWIGHSLISLKQVSKIKKKVIWTLHDEWVTSGITHYQEISDKDRRLFRNFLLKILLVYTKRKKQKIFDNLNLQLIPVSSEIKKKLLEEYPHIEARIHVIPNGLDTSIFYPTDQVEFGLPTVLFLGGVSDSRKGWDLLHESFMHTNLKYNVLLTGSNLNEKIGNVQISGIPRITSTELLRKALSNASTVVVPSRAEALPQVATEAISCGTPVVAFQIGGLPDVVIENVTGILVSPFNTQELAQAIDKVLLNGKSFYKEKCRKFAIKTFSFESVCLRYQKLF
jgi:glycosyltransferase involved in cell wall biosynthesis